jgi:pyruvate/2-oxoglutarate dehydrogenase complex dihydrolipoamide acyltransferase (E2) component
MIRDLLIEPPPDAGPSNVELRVAAGDHIEMGDIIAIVETDKATQEVEAFCDAIIKETKKTPRGWKLIVDEI